MRTPRFLLVTIGVLLALEGIVGVVSPKYFQAFVIWLQSPPAWPASVVFRAVLGVLLFAAPQSLRAPGVVRAVGIITLVGAVVGAFATGAPSLPGGSVWRVPAAALGIAGAAVVWASAAKRHVP